MTNQWARLEYPTHSFHVIPVADQKDHEQTDCWCAPREETFENGNTLIVHHSADGREQWEGLPIL